MKARGRKIEKSINSTIISAKIDGCGTYFSYEDYLKFADNSENPLDEINLSKLNPTEIEILQNSQLLFKQSKISLEFYFGMNLKLIVDDSTNKVSFINMKCKVKTFKAVNVFEN